MIIEYLKKKNLIICPNNLKETVIYEINQASTLISYKIIDMNEFLENYFFSYDKKTIFYLIEKFNMKYENALEYIKAMYYLKDKKYTTNKLIKLQALKQELIEKKLLKFNPLFHNYLLDTNIVIYGYDFLDPFYIEILKTFPSYHQVVTTNKNIKHSVYEFDDILEEVSYICHDIKKKLDSGISINQIKIITPASEYQYQLRKVFAWCHIPISLSEKTSLYQIKIGKTILEKLKNNQTLEEIVDSLKEEKIPLDLLDKVLKILNEYIEFQIDTSKFVSMIEYDLKHTYLTIKEYSNCVTIKDFSEIEDNDYAYLLGFNKENYPTLYKDEDYLSDSMKQELGLFDSNQKNIQSRNILLKKIGNIKNLLITYKNKTAFSSYNPCLLISEVGDTLIKNEEPSYNISNFYNKMVLAKKYDNFYKYGVVDDTLKLLHYNYHNLNYRTYQNQFTSLDNSELLASLKKPFTLSFSTIDEYYRCSFRYYISNILKIKKDDFDDFYKNVGTIFHAVLAKFLDTDFDFDSVWNREIKEYNFTLDKIILLEKLKQELEFDIKVLKKQLEYSSFRDFLFEKRFVVPIKNNQNISVNFVGIADKISYLKENDRTLVSVIDYKTGHLPTELNNIIYGIGMQLPIYLYLVKRSYLFPNAEIVGFYLQKIINGDMKKQAKKTLEELKENALKLVGYSIDKEDILEKFDITYEDSMMISGLKKKTEGFYAYSKILSEKQLDNMDNLVDSKIKEATTNILNGNFMINPKQIDKDNVGCEFCSYRDICYHTEKDYVKLEKHRNLDFLGGDDNA